VQELWKTLELGPYSAEAQPIWKSFNKVKISLSIEAEIRACYFHTLLDSGFHESILGQVEEHVKDCINTYLIPLYAPHMITQLVCEHGTKNGHTEKELSSLDAAVNAAYGTEVMGVSARLYHQRGIKPFKPELIGDIFKDVSAGIVSMEEELDRHLRIVKKEYEHILSKNGDRIRDYLMSQDTAQAKPLN
jgi:hypothetical protein